MDAGLIGIGVTVCFTTIAGIVWAVRIEGRVNGHDALFIERKDQAEERQEDIKSRLVRIEQKLDNANTAQATKDIRR